ADQDLARRHRARRRAGRCGRAVRPADPRDRCGREDRRSQAVRPRPGRPGDCGSRVMAQAETRKPKSGWINVLVDYGPLLIFFLTYRHYKPDGADSAGEIFAVIRGTGAFILAALVALAISKWRLGKV